MKDRIIAAAMRLAVIVAAGLAAVACRVDKGSGDFDYTSAGYMLFNNANDALQEFSKAIDRMQGLDLYIGAADDATREAIRNRFFHDKRIVPDAQNEGIWLIISESATMEIDTAASVSATRAPHGATPTSTASTTAAAARRCAAPPPTPTRSTCRPRPTPTASSSMPRPTTWACASPSSPTTRSRDTRP